MQHADRGPDRGIPPWSDTAEGDVRLSRARARDSLPEGEGPVTHRARSAWEVAHARWGSQVGSRTVDTGEGLPPSPVPGSGLTNTRRMLFGPLSPVAAVRADLHESANHYGAVTPGLKPVILIFGYPVWAFRALVIHPLGVLTDRVGRFYAVMAISALATIFYFIFS